MKTAWLFPGQGSQSVGMGRDLFAAFEPARRLLEDASTMMDVDLAGVIRRGPDTLLTRTDYLQPAVTVVNLGCALLLEAAGETPHALAGHSLGEYSALCCAGVFSAHDCLRLVIERGRLMHAESSRHDAGMLAIKDGELDDIERMVAALSADFTISIANYNGPRQIVVTGERTALDRLSMAQTALGARCIALNVSGAWHSALLAPAAERFIEVLRTVRFHSPKVPLALNVTGALTDDGAVIDAAMQRQLCAPVQWMQAQRALHDHGVRRLLEVGPGKVLRGLARGIAETAACDVVNVDGPKALRFVVKAVPEVSFA